MPCGPASRRSINLKSVLKAKKLNTNVGDEGGFAPDLKSNAEALDLILEAIQKAGYKPGEQIKIAIDVAATELFDEKTKKYSVDGRELELAGNGRFSGRLGREVSDLLDRRRLLAKTIGKAGRCSASGWATKCNWSATTCSSPTPSDLQRGIDERHRQQHSDQGQPDRHADRNDRMRSNWPIATATPASPAIAAARPKTARSPTWPWPWAPARSKPARPPAPIAWPNTTSCLELKKNWATRPCTPARCSKNADHSPIARSWRNRSNLCRRRPPNRRGSG